MGLGHIWKLRLRLPVGLIWAAALFRVAVVNAQAPPAQPQDRAELLRAQPRPTYAPMPADEEEGYAIATPSDKDLGKQQILKRAEEYKPLTVSFYPPFYYTSNVALVRNAEEGDVLVAPGVSVLYQPRIARNFYGEIGLAQQFFFYDRFTELDFASFDAIAGLVYYLPQFHNLTLRGRYDYNRLTDTNDFDEFFVDHSFVLNAELPFRIGRAQQLALGLGTDLSFWSNPDAPRRNDYSIYAAYSVLLSRSFSIDAAGRIAVRDYHVGDRTDVTEILALSANYRVQEWFVLSFLSSFAWNQSDQSVFDYHVANVGGGLALTLKF